MVSDVQPLELRSWQRSFYFGNRLQAEVELFASYLLSEDGLRPELESGCALLHSSYGVTTSVILKSFPVTGILPDAVTVVSVFSPRLSGHLCSHCPTCG